MFPLCSLQVKRVWGRKMRASATVLVVGLWIGFSPYAFGDALDDATAAERRDDCPAALSIYNAQAAKGIAQAFARLGYFNEIGYCVKRDWVEAAKWYGKAADAGDQGAAASLSFIGRQWRYMYYGKPLNPTVYELIEKFAKSGSSVAQFSLGVMNYPIGDEAFDGTIRNPGATGNLQEALSWYRRAADQGDFDGLVALGIAYSEGLGVPQDYVEAHKIFNVAASRVKYGDMRADIMKRRDDLAVKMTPTQIAEAQKLAREWKPTK